MDPLNLLTVDPVDPEGFNAFVAEKLDCWFEKAKTLSPDQRKAFRKKISAMAKNICQDISRMSSLSYSSGQKALQASRLLNSLHDSADEFFNACREYERMKLNEHHQLNAIQQKIQEAVIDFTPFAPSDCNSAAISQSEEKEKNDHTTLHPADRDVKDLLEEGMNLNRLIAWPINQANSLVKHSVKQVAPTLSNHSTSPSVPNRLERAAINASRRIEQDYHIPQELSMNSYSDIPTTISACIPGLSFLRNWGAAKVLIPTLYRQFQNNRNLAPIPSSAIPKHQDVYFHATSFENALKILGSRKITRLDAGLNQGAFVSTIPEVQFGDVIFAFNRSIESSSKVLNAEFSRRDASHWAGFSESIPVNGTTLEYIGIRETILSEKSIESLTKQFSNLANREITVAPLQPIRKLAKHRAKLEGVFVPEEWPTSMEHPTTTSIPE